MIQDIHLSDRDLWEQFYQYWTSGQYQDALNVLQNSQLTDKYFNATMINNIQEIVRETEETALENEDWKYQQIIKLAEYPPSDMDVGEVYFQIVR